jgi:hypothetical protein
MVMNTHADKTTEANSNAAANGVAVQQGAAHERTFQSEDNRPETIAQRIIQEAANNSVQAKRLNAVQAMANNSPQIKQLRAVQALADENIYNTTQFKEINENQAGQHKLKDVSLKGTNMPVQRLVIAQILSSKKKGKIGEIAIVGRPDNVFSGTKGDHLTAFTTIQVGIESRLRDKTLREASVIMAELYSDLLKLPGMKLMENLPIGHYKKLSEKLSELSSLVDYFRSWRRKKNKRKKEVPFEQSFGFALKNDDMKMKEISNDVVYDNSSDDIKDEPIQEDNYEDYDNYYNDNYVEDYDNYYDDSYEMEEQNKKKEDNEKEDDDDEPDAEYLSNFQLYISAYLEVRELVPLSTINTKAVSAALAGKGKGESARELERYEKEGGNDKQLCETILGLFDARAAAVVIMNKSGIISPGVTHENEDNELFKMMVTQHFQTLHSLFPKSMQRITDLKIKGEIWKELERRTLEKIEENKKAAKENKKQKGYKPKPGTGKKYVAAGLIIEDNIIVDVQIAGRSKSPFSQTMGAHTTAWVVITDRIWSGLFGKTLEEAASILLKIGDEVETHLRDSLNLIRTDTKQLYALQQVIINLGQSQLMLQKIVGDFEKTQNIFNLVKPEVPSWERAAHLQEAIVAILDVVNITPGATLYVGDTTGDKEGHHRAVLLQHMDNPGCKTVEEVRKAVEGLLDIKHLDEYISIINKSIRHEKKERQQGLQYLDEIFETKFEPKNKESEIKHFLKEHHFDMISEAYPGVLRYIGMEEYLEDDKYNEINTYKLSPNISGEKGIDFFVLHSVDEFIQEKKFKTDKKIFVVDGSNWACYIRCVLYSMNRMDVYEQVMTLAQNHNVGIKNGVQVNSDTEDQIRKIIRHLTGTQYYVYVTHVASGMAGTSSDTNGTKISIILTGAHFSLLY